MAIEPKDMISTSRIIDIKSNKKNDVLEELIQLLAASPLVADPQQLREKIFERERTLSTGVGEGMAIPHVKIPSIRDFVAAIGRSRAGIDFESLDKKPTHIVVMIGCNNTQSGDFLKVLARLVTRLKDPGIQKRILEAETAEEIREVFIKPEGVLV
jgi:mannitol/fructose-specific phosphotransferase system IIA component (Ntr-type)